MARCNLPKPGKVIFDTLIECVQCNRWWIPVHSPRDSVQSFSHSIKSHLNSSIHRVINDRSNPKPLHEFRTQIRFRSNTSKEDCLAKCGLKPPADKMPPIGKYKIVMVRHGESEWNEKNLFCGWFDAELSSKGNLGEMMTMAMESILTTNPFVLDEVGMRLSSFLFLVLVQFF